MRASVLPRRRPRQPSVRERRVGYGLLVLLAAIVVATISTVFPGFLIGALSVQVAGEFAVSEELGKEVTPEKLDNIEFGRALLEAEVLKAAQAHTEDLGIEILDFRFKRINYVEQVRREVYARMISERKRMAEQFRSEGLGESARISGEKERELKQISSEAYRQAQEIKGQADAEAADIYARAYNRDAEFYRFYKSMQVLKTALDEETVLLLGTDGEFLRYLEQAK